MGNKRKQDDISSDNEEEDSDKTPTNEKVSEDDNVTPNETINDITDMKNSLEVLKRITKGEKVGKKELDSVKEEYSSFFDEESGNTTEREGIDEIIDYLEGELSEALGKASLAGLNEALDEISQKTSDKSFEGIYEPSLNKRLKTSEGSSENSPLDYVLEKQSSDPLDPNDDLD
jgi:hypothetical protein